MLTVVFVVILHYEKNEVKRFEDATDQYIVLKMQPYSYRMGLII